MAESDPWLVKLLGAMAQINPALARELAQIQAEDPHRGQRQTATPWWLNIAGIEGG